MKTSRDGLRSGWILPGLAATAIGFAPAAGAQLIGPITSPPGGVDVVDTDPGTGEQWGRAGGRNREYSNLDVAQFANLLWGVGGADAVRAAFDGAIDSPGETLAYADSATDRAAGVARWLGSSQVDLYTPGSATPVLLQLLLAVTDGTGAPVPLALDPGTGLPVLDVLALPAPVGTFNVNIRFEANGPAGVGCPTGFQPALDLFDCLPTTGDELALTSLDTGFFFEFANLALAAHDQHLTEHDEAVRDALSDLDSEVDFLFTDWPLKWNSLLQGTGDILTAVGALEVKADQLGSIALQVSDIQNRVQTVASNDTLLFLWGIQPTLDVGGGNTIPFSFVRDNSPVYQVLDGLDAAVAALEQKADASGATIVDLDARTVTIANAIDALEAKADALGADVDAVAGAVSAANLGIGALNAKADDTQAAIATLEAKADALGTNVASIATRLDAIESAISALPVDIDIEIVESPQTKGGGKRLLVLTRQNGLEQTASIVSVIAIVKGHGGAVDTVAVPFTSQALTTGVTEIQMELEKDLKSAKTFLLLVEDDSSGTTRYGSALVSLRSEGDFD